MICLKQSVKQFMNMIKSFKNYKMSIIFTNIENSNLSYNAKDLIVMGLSGSEMIKAAKDCGLKSASEVFADRAYEEDGTLVNRRKPGAMIEDEDEAINRVVRMIKEGKVTSITGKDIDIKADSVCVHGDGEKALLFVEKIRKTFGENEIEICHL